MPTTPPQGSDRTSTPSRLLITLAALAVALFIALEPYLFEASRSLQLFQGGLIMFLWLVFMVGTTRRVE
jgi:hypothetical protein